MKAVLLVLIFVGILFLDRAFIVQSKRKQSTTRESHGNKPNETSESDHYSVLGLKSTASAKEVKKAYHSLAKKWHPDKNVGNEKDAKDMFMNIAKAYEILADDDMRKIYDAYGNEGVLAKQRGGNPEEWAPVPPPRQPKTRSGNGGNFQRYEQYHSGQGGSAFSFGEDFSGFSNEDLQSLFRTFGRGSGVKGMDGSNRMDRSPRQKDLYAKEGNVIPLGKSTFVSQTSAHAWLLAFYSNDSRESVEDKQAVDDCARGTKALFKVGAINCGGRANQNFCFGMGVDSVPKYAALIDGKLHFWDKSERPTAKALHAFVTSHLPESKTVNRVASIAGILDSKRTTAILLLTDKFETTPLWRGLAYAFRSELTFAESRAASVEMGREFKVKKYPVIVALEAGRKDGYRLIETYDGELNMQALSDWCHSILRKKKSGKRRWFFG
eukprot:CAMPEP_0171730300 /NCGR_PEP_ID=MMETSP0991-20121206/28196_1 /TAXON_ID=483369 /ORGANISM="non described non described, Strain CCMP2098" /LENGTH=437 /DNA_ID=CAMNT_0012324981 /DNA_START=52 /DNA_END=1365 /DNA_ORIENTATION=+